MISNNDNPTLRTRATRHKILGPTLRFGNNLIKLTSRLKELKSQLAVTQGRLDNHIGFSDEKLAAVESSVNELRIVLKSLAEKVNSLDQRASDLTHQVNLAQPAPRAEEGAPTEPGRFVDNHLLDQFYIQFENTFRGLEQDIMSRQAVYLPYFRKTGLDFRKYPVVDLGCGRGELLELLTQNNIRVIGVDLNERMVARSLEKGFEATQADAISYLVKQPSQSIGAVTGFQIVEHIPFESLLRLFAETYRSLVPGGIAVFETPNPENIIVATSSFYLDPSHLKPLPPALLQFAMQTQGFMKTEILRLHPAEKSGAEDEKSGQVNPLDKYFYGERDYAVIATKR